MAFVGLWSTSKKRKKLSRFQPHRLVFLDASLLFLLQFVIQFIPQAPLDKTSTALKFIKFLPELVMKPWQVVEEKKSITIYSPITVCWYFAQSILESICWIARWKPKDERRVYVELTNILSHVNVKLCRTLCQDESKETLNFIKSSNSTVRDKPKML